jgi:hypothetical protein
VGLQLIAGSLQFAIFDTCAKLGAKKRSQPQVVLSKQYRRGHCQHSIRAWSVCSSYQRTASTLLSRKPLAIAVLRALQNPADRW